MRLLLQHKNRYQFPEPAALGPHIVRLRPTAHCKAKIDSYALHIRVAQPDGAQVRWHQDPFGNHVARVGFKAGQAAQTLDVDVEIAVEIKPVNPFDFVLDADALFSPFAYSTELQRELAPFLDLDAPALAHGELFEKLLATLTTEPAKKQKTVDLLVEVNTAVNQAIAYVIREEAGVYTPEETLTARRGSCRDSAMLLAALFRSKGIAARFVSGYLVQLVDEGMIPDTPKGVLRDVMDLHAWCEVFLPGAGWVGLDGTSGLFCGEGHIPLASAASPALAAPIEGTTSVGASAVSFEMLVTRLSDEARPTAPFSEDAWQDLLAASVQVDAAIARRGFTLTMGGEPTFNAREFTEEPEWNSDALGPTKWELGLKLSHQLRERLAPGGVMLVRQGKWYPGESLPRWAIELIHDPAEPIWRGPVDVPVSHHTAADALVFAKNLASRLGLEKFVQTAYEDPWRAFQEEEALPVDVDPLEENLASDENRRRLARLLERGLATPAAYVLPLAREGAAWVSEPWKFRRGRLFLTPGDSPAGLRLPTNTLPAVPPTPLFEEPKPGVVVGDPRRKHTLEVQQAAQRAWQERRETAQLRSLKVGTQPNQEQVVPERLGQPVRTSMVVEARDGRLFVFLPPTVKQTDFVHLVKTIDQTREDLSLDVVLEGYGPPPHGPLHKMAVTPDPGVLEVNLAPKADLASYQSQMMEVFDAALHAGLHSEKYMLDGRLAGSGGGHHLTLGGTSVFESPFIKRPDVLASLLTFLQHHPSLSYLFTGLFVGPTSQAPRVDEARTDAIYELEIALREAHAIFQRGEEPPPWMSDFLFRHMLVDMTGNTHRTELSIDKLFDPATPFGRQGLVEFRAFEMPPHPRMAVAQMALVRALVASFLVEPYQAPLVRWGQRLSDQFFLPYFLGRDIHDVLRHLDDHGLKLPSATYQPFVDLRCPLVGTLQAGDVRVEVRNALEPWHVLGEEVTGSGTARYVDSSMERIEVRAEGLVHERHVILVNGRRLPMFRTPHAGETVAGVRFRAWAPPHAMHPHLGIHHPVRIDVVDTWGKRSLGACAYHVWHPEGQGYDSPPLTRFEASARRAQRFTLEGPLSHPVAPLPAEAHPDAPWTLDLRQFDGDRPMPEPDAK